MEPFVYLIIGIAVGGALGYFVALSYWRKKSTPVLPTEDNSGLVEENKTLIADLASWKTRHQSLQEKLEEQQQEWATMQQQFKAEFKNLANEILEKNSEKFTQQNKANLDVLLNPLKEKITSFEKQVEEKYLKETEGRSALIQQIKGLAELNKQMSEEALNLTRALKGDSKVQGDWGEQRLELILEKAGLQKDIHYATQQTFKDEDGNLQRPDFIIKLPDNKNLVIDSKVSLTAYEAFYRSEEEEEQQVHLKNHLLSIKKHIKELGEKKYHNLYDINTPDYVLMYIPIEPAFSLALQHDEKLYLDALDKNIVMVTTSTLLATMSTVSSIWRQEDQKKNVLEIARQSGALYDKFSGFVDDLIEVGKRMDSAKKHYEGAMNKLSTGKGNLVKRAEDIKKLGAKTTKSINATLVERSANESGEIIDTTPQSPEE